MRLIKPSFEVIPQEPGKNGIFKQIELAGRTCYKSENKITENSAQEFVNRMVKSDHSAMLEHGTIYLKVKWYNIIIILFYFLNSYSKVKRWNYITTNYRVLVENEWLDDLKYMCEPTEFHEKRVTVRFIMDRIGSQSFCRHRKFSFAQESTRYCNYSKDKFGNELTFIIPSWFINEEQENMSLTLKDVFGNTPAELEYKTQMCCAEKSYFSLLSKGWTPQQARTVLPCALKTELIMTGFVSDWKHFFKLRDDSHAHPQAQELAKPLHDYFKNHKNKWL